MSTMSAYMSALAKEKRSVNTGMLAGNGTIRAGVKGYAPGKLSKEEVHQVWKAVEESLAAGALGISLGIAYAPEFEYDRDGLVEALQPLKARTFPLPPISEMKETDPSGFAGSDFCGGRAADPLACKPHEMHRKKKLGRDTGEDPKAV